MPDRSGFPIPHASIHISGQFWTVVVIFRLLVSAKCSTWLIEENEHAVLFIVCREVLLLWSCFDDRLKALRIQRIALSCANLRILGGSGCYTIILGTQSGVNRRYQPYGHWLSVAILCIKMLCVGSGQLFILGILLDSHNADHNAEHSVCKFISRLLVGSLRKAIR